MTAKHSQAPVLFPAVLKLEGLSAVVAGGGPVAARKATALADAGARVTVIAPRTVADIRGLVAEGRVRHIERRWRRRDGDRARIVVAATDDERLNATIGRRAGRKGSWVNVVDSPDLCTLHMPSCLRRGDLTVAVSTGGRSPALARRVRESLERLFSDPWNPHPATVLDAAQSPPSALVSIVGAGPGDAGLITLRGLEALRHADVVAYDHLVNPELLMQAREDARLVYVGKHPAHAAERSRHAPPPDRRGDPCADRRVDQSRIDALLVEEARRGHRVCRLKGGDPMIFGRGGEEARHLARAGVPFEIVPGVSSAHAVPAYAGIPLTYRGVASCFTVVTGHEDPSKESSGLDWDSLAKGKGTLVFLMGVKNLEAIVRRLLAHGRDPSTPAALIRWGTTPGQLTISGSLEDIAPKAREARVRPPAVFVVGEVVGMREALAWFESAPPRGDGRRHEEERPQRDRSSRALVTARR